MHSANGQCEYINFTALYLNTTSTRTSEDCSKPHAATPLCLTGACLAQISARLYDIVEEIPPHPRAFVDVLPLQAQQNLAIRRGSEPAPAWNIKENVLQSILCWREWRRMQIHHPRNERHGLPRYDFDIRCRDRV